MKVVAIKDINNGKIYPMQVDRHLASYGKINNKYTVEWKDNILKKKPFSNFKKIRLEEADYVLKKIINYDQYISFYKRMKAFDLSYIHSTITDIIEEDEEYYTIIYHVITTKGKEVDYGGPNKFNPIFLYHDD